MAEEKSHLRFLFAPSRQSEALLRSGMEDIMGWKITCRKQGEVGGEYRLPGADDPEILLNREGEETWRLCVTNRTQAPWAGVIRVEYHFPKTDPRFFMPAFLYGRNKGEWAANIRWYYPRLREGECRLPYAPWWMVRSDRLSHPSVFVFDGGRIRGISASPYFLAEKETHEEKKNPYYRFLENDQVVENIFKEFGIDGDCRHIVNGHVPVHHTEGESPIKCGGKLLIIDGGFSKAYQKVTGIAGYTLIYNSWGMILAAHEPFTSARDAITKESDILSASILIKKTTERKTVAETDNGLKIKERIAELQELLKAYRDGLLIEKL